MVNYVLYYVCLCKWLKKEKSMVKLKLQNLGEGNEKMDKIKRCLQCGRGVSDSVDNVVRE